MSENKRSGWLPGGVLSFLVALGVAGAATFLDWRANPGQLFQDHAGTRWSVVWDTFISWFLPTLLLAALILVPASIVYRRWKP